MNVQIALKELQIHETPLEEISYGTNAISVTFDDVDENRWEFTFSPFQAIKTITVDCYPYNDLLTDEARDNWGIYRKYLLEVNDSAWIKSLAKELKKNDRNATFLEKSHHYILPFQDIVVEIVAWGFNVQRKS